MGEEEGTPIGSCGWRWHRASGRSTPRPDARFALFAREGFDADLVALARPQGQRLLLHTSDDLFL